MTSALSFSFLFEINSRCAVPTNSVPTDGGTTIGAPAFTSNAPRLVITIGAFTASARRQHPGRNRHSARSDRPRESTGETAHVFPSRARPPTQSSWKGREPAHG